MSEALSISTVIEPMSERDIPAVVALEESVSHFPWSVRNFEDSLKSGYSCWVCKEAGMAIGYFIVMIAVDEAHLLNIGVLPSLQGKGHGAKLLRCAMLVAKRHHAETFLLEVRPSNDKALSLYRHYGFKQIGVRRNYYEAVTGREDALVMTYPLAELTV